MISLYDTVYEKNDVGSLLVSLGLISFITLYISLATAIYSFSWVILQLIPFRRTLLYDDIGDGIKYSNIIFYHLFQSFIELSRYMNENEIICTCTMKNCKLRKSVY